MGSMATEDSSKWKKCSLPMSLRTVHDYDLIEVLRCAAMPKTPMKKEFMSAEVREARDALTDSPHSMYWINELGRIYASQAQWDKCELVMLRGWKRAAEIADPHTRFCFLAKLCEVSYYLGKYKQAVAVLKDVEEPASPEALKGLLLLACRVYACNNDLEGALKAFTRAVEGEDFTNAMKVLAMTNFDLRKAGAYEPARQKVEAMAKEHDHVGMLQMLDEAAVQKPRTDNVQRLEKLFLGGGFAVALVFLGVVLYYVEQWSLSRFAKNV